MSELSLININMPNSSGRCNCASHQPELVFQTVHHKCSFYYSIESLCPRYNISLFAACVVCCKGLSPRYNISLFAACIGCCKVLLPKYNISLFAACIGCCKALRPRYKRLIDDIFPVNPEVKKTVYHTKEKRQQKNLYY